MTNDLISLEPIERREPAKIKTHFARIIVGGQIEKPCYSILWFDPANMEYQIGYSSYCLEYVFQWLKEEFEIAGDGFTNEPVRHGRWIEAKGAIRCTECMNTPLYDYFGKIKLSDACPHCGVKMEVEHEAD